MTTHEPAFDLSSESPGKIALRTLVRDRRSWIASSMLLVVIALTLFAPLYASLISKTDPFVSTINGTVVLDGVEVQVLQQSTEGLKLGVNPIGLFQQPHSHSLLQPLSVLSRAIQEELLTLLSLEF